MTLRGQAGKLHWDTESLVAFLRRDLIRLVVCQARIAVLESGRLKRRQHGFTVIHHEEMDVHSAIMYSVCIMSSIGL